MDRARPVDDGLARRVIWWAATDGTGLRLYIGGALVWQERAPARLLARAEDWLAAARTGAAWPVPGGAGAVTLPADFYGLARDALALATRGGLAALAQEVAAGAAEISTDDRSTI
jgi:hypothetical protein